MITFILWTALILTSICFAVYLFLLVVMCMSGIDMWRKRRALYHPLPPPDKVVERMYGQQYFERAMKNK